MIEVTAIGFDRSERHLLRESVLAVRAVFPYEDDVIRLISGLSKVNANDPAMRERLERGRRYMELALKQLRVEEHLEYWTDPLPDRCDCGLENPGPEHRQNYPMLCSDKPRGDLPGDPYVMAQVLAEARGIQAEVASRALTLLSQAVARLQPVEIPEEER